MGNSVPHEIYSFEVPNTADPSRGWGPIHRSGMKMSPQLGLVDDDGSIILTSYENFRQVAAKYPDANCLGYRPIISAKEIRDAEGGGSPVRIETKVGPYKWFSYQEIVKRCDDFGAGLVNLELCPERPDVELNNRGVLGFYSKNVLEWFVAEQGCYAHSIVPVPMYDTLDPDAFTYTANLVEFTTVITTEDLISNVIIAKSNCPKLTHIVQMDGNGVLKAELVEKCNAVGLELIAFLSVEKSGREHPVAHRPPNPQDVMTFCFTSGTTGNPKGALITHQNIVSNYVSVLGNGLIFLSGEIHLSYLPLPHMFERIWQFGVIASGGSIGFYQGDTLKIVEDLQALRPTVFPSVPRLLNRIHDKLIAGVNEAGGIKKVLFDRGFAAKMQGLKNGSLTHGLWDRLVFSKIKAKVGLDRVRFVLTGSAPIADNVLSFLRVVFGCFVHEGYGMTETAAAAAVTLPNDLESGTVGPPLSCNEIRLMDVPDMNYLQTDIQHGTADAIISCRGRGEICFRGPNIFKGYYKAEDKTKEAFDEDGWLHSGDIGLWTLDGRLKIIDRKKNIFKLAQGEYVAAEKVENVILGSSFVMQNFVYGDSYKTSLVAIVVPDPDRLAGWAKANGFSGSHEDLCKNDRVKAAILDNIREVSKKEKLMGFEIVKDIYLESSQWSPADVLTPTFKMKRNDAKKKYISVIDSMYAEIDRKSKL